ncbi:serine/threonine-protein phosphatase 7 long form homolog [Pistacia vera]|uniref:serine/threonine-protein phosphatase 7 long form homolog n=1 Tax=Pistacia vera TaxID=55513 RepID=UPI00126302D0|nr:serine/threonine-protein phosphatase 7 long form homolog [Pistacia vera]
MQCYAKAYILDLLGSLFPDKSGLDVQLIFLPLLRDFKYAGKFSWGSVVLAYLYRELCRASKKGASEISCHLMLLQLWAWERLHIGHLKRFVTQE